MAVDKKGLTFDKRVEHHKFAKTQSPAVSSGYQLPGTSILGAYLDKEIILPLFFFTPWPNQAIGSYLTVQYRVARTGGRGAPGTGATPETEPLLMDSNVDVYWGS